MKIIEIVVKKTCPICMMVMSELERHRNSISLKSYLNSDLKGKLLIKESGLKNAPILKVNGKFYSGKDALLFVKTWL